MVKPTGVAKKPLDSGSADRKAIIQAIRGPVIQRFVVLVPGLAASGDPYATVLQNPDLLFGCLQIFKKERSTFQDLLVDASGNPVADDDTPLRCGRNTNQVVGMVVRSGCKAYAEKKWAGEKEQAAKPVMRPETKTLLDRLRELVQGKWSESEQPKPTPNQADKFYAAINDHLNFDWQVPLIPHFAELPVKLLLELGSGCTTLRNPEAICQLADIGRHNLDQARKILSDSMMREMLETQPLAAKGVAFLGKERYEFLHSAVYEKMGEKFWQMCTDCDRLEAIEEKNAKDLEQICEFLDSISAETINQVLRFIPFNQMSTFLEIARDRLGEETFVKIFGVPGSKKLIKIFCEKTSAIKLDPGEPIEDLRRRLPDVFGAYLRSPKEFEKGL